MGWWSTDVLGGDAPLDVLGDIARLLDLEDLYRLDALEVQAREVARAAVAQLMAVEPFEGVLWRLGGAPTDPHFDQEHAQVATQVLATVVMAVGAPMPPLLREQALLAAELDVWATRDPDRRAHMDALAAKVRGYHHGQVLDTPTTGLLTALAHARGQQ